MVAVLQYAVCAQEQRYRSTSSRHLLTNAVGWSMHTELSAASSYQSLSRSAMPTWQDWFQRTGCQRKTKKRGCQLATVRLQATSVGDRGQEHPLAAATAAAWPPLLIRSLSGYVATDPRPGRASQTCTQQLKVWVNGRVPRANQSGAVECCRTGITAPNK